MELDLHHAGVTLDDLGDKLSLPGLVAAAVYAPPGSYTFHKVNHGWSVNDHLQAQAIDALNLLVWSKTVDAQEKRPKHKPQPIPRPGTAEEEPPPPAEVLTVGEYMKRLEERKGK